jgi:hypothetical protein
VLTKAHVKFCGTVQVLGIVVPEIAKPVIARPSLEVNAMLMVCEVPTATLIGPSTEGVAMTVSSVPVKPPPPLLALPVVVPPPLLLVPLVTFPGP